MNTPANSRRLTSEEIQHLLQKLSSDEQKELGQMLKVCTTEMTFTRGLPFAAAVIGSLYFARKRLPPALHFGPKKWPFYVVVGIGALTTANLLSMSNCTERIQPHLSALWQKHSSESSSGVSYEDLRRRNREAIPVSSAESKSGDIAPFVGQQQQQQLASSNYSKGFDWKGTQSQISSFSYDEPSYMSGTPVGVPKKTQYGDEGFS
uniref:OCIA domain-containing protein n=1 Tax=Parascaris univalens TaxID=6257 RepID=A0A914ZUT0_PARUN